MKRTSEAVAILLTLLCLTSCAHIDASFEAEPEVGSAMRPEGRTDMADESIVADNAIEYIIGIAETDSIADADAIMDSNAIAASIASAEGPAGPQQTKAPMEAHAENPVETPTRLRHGQQTVREAGPEAGNTSCHVGEEGPNGGLVFECDGVFLEIGEPLYGAQSHQEAEAYCKGMGYRLPCMAELYAIHMQLVETALSELEITYYWSSEKIDGQSARVLNFDTGFEGAFFMDMDFVSAVPVIEIR